MEYLENSGSVSVNAFAGIGAAAILPAFIENFIGNGVAEKSLYKRIFTRNDSAISLRESKGNSAAGCPVRPDA